MRQSVKRGDLMKTKTLLMIGLTLVSFLAIATVRANVPDASKYIGTKMCGMCHKSEKTGDQLGKWQASPHAKAFETLGTDKAKEVAKAKGIDDPQKAGECLQCHSTAHNFTTTVQTTKVKVDEGVGCESCHGPGQDYKSKSVMEDHGKSVAAGLVFPATKNCTLCHNDKSPTFKGFDEKAHVEKIAHPNPAKK